MGYTAYQMKYIIPKTLFPHQVSLSEEHIRWKHLVNSHLRPFSGPVLSHCAFSTLTTLSTHFSAKNIPTPSVFALLPIQNSLYLLPTAPKNLHPEPLHRVSWTHAKSIRLSASASTSSPDLPVSESTFQVPSVKGQPFRSLSALGDTIQYYTKCRETMPYATSDHAMAVSTDKGSCDQVCLLYTGWLDWQTAATDAFDLSSVIKHSNCNSGCNNSAWIAKRPIHVTEYGHVIDTTAACGSQCVGGRFARR